jgi:hypothetical protein
MGHRNRYANGTPHLDVACTDRMKTACNGFFNKPKQCFLLRACKNNFMRQKYLHLDENICMHFFFSDGSICRDRRSEPSIYAAGGHAILIEKFLIYQGQFFGTPRSIPI